MSSPAISVQLYSVHEALDADLTGTLGRIADIGFSNVEAFDFVRRADALRAAFDEHGLHSPTGHARLLEGQAATPDAMLTMVPTEQTFAAAAALGISVVIDPFVPPERWVDREQIERTADQLNALVPAAVEHGLRLGYHNHDHELSAIVDGRPALEVFADLLDDQVVLEVDLYWAAAGGVDPVALLRRLGDRVLAVHVKDGPLRPGITAASIPDDQVPAGQGDVPLVDALLAGNEIAYAVVEFDRYAGDLFDGIAESHAFLSRTLGV